VNFGLFSGQPEFAGQNGNSRGLYGRTRKTFNPGSALPGHSGGRQEAGARGAYTISSFMEGTGTNLRLT